MGIKSKPGGFSLPWGSSKVGKVDKCHSCKKEAYKLQYVASDGSWICSECSARPMLEKGRMFGKGLRKPIY